ncbi:right-handed parallel beta-helix repeat-containing protein [Micromonospora sp. NPDC005174]|uniref:right-handed parallel beta-helix repeat-containing protein n=1 Tax=unclassified Micromonospora TaxID=2617518 RepID=UPI0033A4B6D1
MLKRLLVALTLAATASTLVAGTAAAAPTYPGQVTCPTGDYQLCINGGPGNFTISGRTFSNHQNAILLTNVSKVTISGNTFTRLSGPKGFAGVHVKNSSGIVIKNNVFSRLSNKGNMHGIYLVNTTGSRITGNTFSSITGDPVRIRNGSNNTTVSGNTFVKSGTYAVFSEWSDPAKGEKVCSRGSTFKNNRYGTAYSGKSIKLIRWGGKGSGTNLSWSNCTTASITNKGGNTKG